GYGLSPSAAWILRRGCSHQLAPTKTNGPLHQSLVGPRWYPTPTRQRSAASPAWIDQTTPSEVTSACAAPLMSSLFKAARTIAAGLVSLVRDTGMGVGSCWPSPSLSRS